MPIRKAPLTLMVMVPQGNVSPSRRAIAPETNSRAAAEDAADRDRDHSHQHDMASFITSVLCQPVADGEQPYKRDQRGSEPREERTTRP